MNVHPLFTGEDEKFLSQSIYTFEKKESTIIEDQKAKDLLLQMLVIDYNERVTASKALEHDYFNEFNMS